jgi:predicted ABC-type ATPase
MAKRRRRHRRKIVIIAGPNGAGKTTFARWRSAGYHVKLIFLSLPSVKLALARVKARVAQGGHDVPPAVIRRRFHAGLRNFQRIYSGLVNSWALYDNSGTEPRLMAAGDNR